MKYTDRIGSIEKTYTSTPEEILEMMNLLKNEQVNSLKVPIEHSKKRVEEFLKKHGLRLPASLPVGKES